MLGRKREKKGTGKKGDALRSMLYTEGNQSIPLDSGIGNGDTILLRRPHVCARVMKAKPLEVQNAETCAG